MPPEARRPNRRRTTRGSARGHEPQRPSRSGSQGRRDRGDRQQCRAASRQRAREQRPREPGEEESCRCHERGARGITQQSTDVDAHERLRIPRLERRGRLVDDRGIQASQQIDRDATDQSGDDTHQRAESQSQNAGRSMRGRDRSDGRRSIFRIPHRADRKDVVLQQLEHDAQLQSRRDVSENRSRNRPGDERPRDHHLRQTHEIDAYERAPDEQGEQNFNGQVHVKSPTGTAGAVGTSCAVTSTPRAASWRSFAASSSVRYTNRSRSVRPVR